MLQEFDVGVNVRTFERDDGIEGLGENPFVSSDKAVQNSHGKMLYYQWKKAP